MTNDDIPGDKHAKRRAFFEEMEDMVGGGQQLTWPLWATPIGWATCLTEAGRAASVWAVEVLRNELGGDYLTRLRASKEEHPMLSPGLLVTLWPMVVDSRRLYEDLLWLAAQFDFARRYGRRWYSLRKILSTNPQAISWTHSLLQLHVFGLAHRDGWSGAFEVRLPNGNPGDLLLEHTDGSRILIEFTSMGMSHNERKAHMYFREMGQRILAIEFQHGVHVRGSLGAMVPEQAALDWIASIEAAAAATTQDGRERYVRGPRPLANIEDAAALQDIEESRIPNISDTLTEVWVTRELIANAGETTLAGGLVTSEPLPRLEARIQDKALSTASADEPTWLYVEDESGLWFFTPLAHMTLAERLAALTPWLRMAIEPYPHIVGIILSPGIVWDAEAANSEAVSLPEFDGALAIRRRVAPSRVREVIIVTRSGQIDASADALSRWYRTEDDWLAWALRDLGQPPLETLFQQQTKIDNLPLT